jgi:hypothetical protein
LLPETSKRNGGDWAPELDALREDPVLMLLGGVVWRAKQDAPESASARRFLARVRRCYAEVGDPGHAVLMAMQNGDREARGTGRGSG